MMSKLHGWRVFRTVVSKVQVRRGRLVYDPFVGTGGVLLAAAHHGAATLGSDIDMRVIRLGKTDKAGQQVLPAADAAGTSAD